MATFHQGPRPEDSYTMIDNALLRDPSIPVEAKGIYGFMRSHRDGWVMTTEKIGKANGMSKNRAAKYINVLIDLGYIVRNQVNENGRFGEVEYIILSTPRTKNRDAVAESLNPQVVPHPENTYDGKHVSRDLDPYKKTNSNKTNFKKTTNTPPSESGGVVAAAPQPDSADEFEAFWKKYPRRKGTSKQDARRKYAQAVKDGARPEQLGAALEEQKTMWANEQREVTKIPHAATWLNQRRWEDADDNWSVQATGPKSGNPFLDLIQGDADVW